MAAAIKTPGVYIKELNAFPNSVVEVATAVPAFIGYTEKIPPGPNVPTRLSSLAEYESYFGKGPKPQFTFTDASKPLDVDPKSRFLLYSSMRLFFDNGGGPCWIVSIGTYDSATKADKKKDDFTGVLPELEKQLEPTMLVAPDAVLLSEDDWQAVCQQFLIHCNKMQSRVSILDVYNGFKSRTYKDDDVIQHFRDRVSSDFLNYGQTYYPWVNTSIVDDSDVDYSLITDASLGALQTALKNAIANVADTLKKAISDLIDQMPAAAARQNVLGEAAKLAEPQKTTITSLVNAWIKQPGDAASQKALTDEVAKLSDPQKTTITNLIGKGTPPAPPAADSKPADGASKPVPAPAPALTQIHRSLRAVSTTYVNVMDNIRKQLNLLPPSGGMAGVYTRIDNALGVFKAPANTGMMSAVSPAVDITHDDQEDLNAPLDGKAVNAIRTFPGRGLLIWGARTLDGNSQDWRYINVRRTIIMLEQSIKYATLAYVFEANTASTWVTVKNMISNFLINQWKAGALMGAKPEEAFSVDVGLGSTMTADDILNGFMNVTVKVALVRPAEFIVITFQQKMPTS